MVALPSADIITDNLEEYPYWLDLCFSWLFIMTSYESPENPFCRARTSEKPVLKYRS